MFPMQNFKPESAVISASSNCALIEKYLRNTYLGQGAILTLTEFPPILSLLKTFVILSCSLQSVLQSVLVTKDENIVVLKQGKIFKMLISFILFNITNNIIYSVWHLVLKCIY